MENNGSGINDVFIHDDAATIAGDSIGIENDVEDNSRIKPVKISMKNIMGIKDFELGLSPNVNVFIGENSTGKTSILKSLYAPITGVIDSGQSTKAKIQAALEERIQKVFRPDDSKIGNLVTKNEAQGIISVLFDNGKSMGMQIGNGAISHVDFQYDNSGKLNCKVVYIPPKEMTSVDGFPSLYENYSIAFEEMYNRIAKQLQMPVKTKHSRDGQKIIADLSELIGGRIFSNNGKLYLESSKDGSVFEMGLLSEGYKKIVTLLYLIMNGNIGRNTILIWDEPETNMNPKMSTKIVDVLNLLAKNGVQVIITTHDYFVAQKFGLIAKYSRDDLKYNFFSLYKEDGNNAVEISNDLFELEHNSIIEEFEELYDRENELRWEEF